MIVTRMWRERSCALCAGVASLALAACGGSGSDAQSVDDGGVATDARPAPEGGDGRPDGGAGRGDGGDVGSDASAADSGGGTMGCTVSDGGAAADCYAITCASKVHTLTANRDRLVADLAKRKCATSCALWAALSQAERYIFLMDTAYLGDTSSRIHPPSHANTETALDHAVALYSINAPDGSTRGGQEYNRIYLGFDALATCVMRSFAVANPAHAAGYNQWVSSDDLAGPHGPFTQREMIYWYKAFYDPQSEGPQFHHWHQDSDFTQSGLNQRSGVCGVTDRSVTELTIAFDTLHNSDPMGDYSGRGGTGSQIVDQHISISADWTYTPTGCAVTPPVNSDPYGGGSFAGMGPTLNGGVCSQPRLGDGGC